MTDRELLEAAAKAAGIETHGWRAHESRPGLYMLPITETGAYLVWNPLIDDGDALRLADTLHIKVMPGQDESCAKTDDNAWICVANNTWPCAATRRAIVRAAAAMLVPSC
jgi:hypothetical protein